MTLDNLSNLELILYYDAISIKGNIEYISQKLEEKEAFNQYKEIHKSYFNLLISANSNEVKLEALKRVIFLNWYSVLEPSCFTSINELDNDIVFESYNFLNNYIKYDNLDKELNWMLSFYSCWEYLIYMFIEDKLPELDFFIKTVNPDVLHYPKKQLPKGTMNNRGQMGIYWKTFVEID